MLLERQNAQIVQMLTNFTHQLELRRPNPPVNLGEVSQLPVFPQSSMLSKPEKCDRNPSSSRWF